MEAYGYQERGSEDAKYGAEDETKDDGIANCWYHPFVPLDEEAWRVGGFGSADSRLLPLSDARKLTKVVGYLSDEDESEEVSLNQ